MRFVREAGNKKADEIAKRGAKGRQQESSASFQEKATFFRAALGHRSERNNFYFLDRWQQVVIVRRRTGDNRLDGHTHRKRKLASSPAGRLMRWLEGAGLI